MRVLVVEDEKEIREYLKAVLQSELFVVDTASDGHEGSYAARTNDYDLIILDNILPKKTGSQVCREIREAGRTTPILMLSVKSAVDEKVSLLECGADDYMTKPYSHKELLARMHALLRRNLSSTSRILNVHEITLNIDSQEVTCNSKKIHLTKKEFSILELLMRHHNKIVSRGTILEHAWDMDGDPFSKTIDTHILNLRKKLGAKCGGYIENVSGRGYIIG